LYLDGFTWFRRRSGGDDEIALGCIYLTLHHLTDLSDRINNGCSGGVGREPGKRLKTAGVLGIVGERQDEGLLRRQSGCSGLQNLNDRLIRRVKPSKHMLGDKAYDSAELRCELHERVPPKTTIANPLAVKKQTFSGSEQQALRNAPPLTVDSPVGLPRTAATWGITGPELNRLCNAVWFMELHCNPSRVGLWLATTARATRRDVIADIWKRITRLQGSYVITFEKSGGIHAHITFLGTRHIAKRLKQSRRFGELLDVRPVTDLDGLTRKYLAKERTPQAGYGREHILGGRIRGSHRLPGGGDRVRLSRELERDAIEAGHVEAWQHSNARRSLARKPYRARRATSGTSRCTRTGGSQ
jgi:hypothetical protein